MMETMPGIVQNELPSQTCITFIVRVPSFPLRQQSPKRTRNHDKEDADDQMSVKKRDLEERWAKQIETEYPNLLREVVYVPSVHVNKQTNDKTTSGRGGKVYRKGSVDSDFRDDRATLQVLRFWWNLAELLKAKAKEETVMLVLSKYILENYLAKTLSGAFGRAKKGRSEKKAKDNDPKASEFFPTPKDTKLMRGEFDLLIMHKKYGFISIEVKAFGDLKQPTEGQENQENQSKKPKTLSDMITKILIQMNKRHCQLMSLTDDLGSDIPITKLAAFPNRTRSQLQEALLRPSFEGKPEEVDAKKACLQTELEKYLVNGLDLSKALRLWLCQDEVTGAQDDAGVMTAWWTQLEDYMKEAGFPGIGDDVYKRIFARFCGPRSIVEVCRWNRKVCEARSIGDSVHVMGTHFDMFVLTEEQKEWRTSQKPFVYFTGPPGSGKTLLMLLKAVLWADGGDAVKIVRGPGNLPGHLVSQDLHKKIVNTLDDESLAANIQLETVTAWTDPARFVEEMVKNNAATGRKVRFLVDELWLAKPTSKFSDLAGQVVKLLEQAKSLSGSGDLTSSVGASELTPPEQVSGERNQILEALDYIIQKDEGWKTVNDIAKVVLGGNDNEQLTKLFTVARELRQTLSSGAEHQQVFASKEMTEIVLNAKFYVSVLESWLASPVLHQVMQEVRRYPEKAGLWCTGFWANRCPEGYTLGKLPRSLRCPAHVQELLDKTEHLASHQDKQYKYYTTSTQRTPPLAAEAPPCARSTYINHGKHAKHVHPGPSGQTKLKCISQCEDCGKELVSVLKDKLSVGDKLQYRDVLIVSRALLPVKPDSVFVQVLKGSDIPVNVVVRGSEDLEEDDLQSNSVLMLNTYNSHGLERSVVVFIPDIGCCTEPDRGCQGNLGGGGGGDDGGLGDDDGGFRFDFESKMNGVGDINRMGIWFIASRCLAHVVMFHV